MIGVGMPSATAATAKAKAAITIAPLFAGKFQRIR